MAHVDQGKLKQYLAKYQNQEVTRRDIMNTVNHYKGLNCQLEPFVFNDGTSIQLCNLQGTIPVPYKSNTYNIPVCIWLMDTHPNNAPMCYVKPTPDMQIKVSMYVDHNGKVYLPYLHDWVPNSSDLLGVIQVMIITFGEQPPVYAKPRNEPSTQLPYPVQSYMPQPSAAGATSGYPGYPPASSYPGAAYTGYQRPPYPPSTATPGAQPPYPTYNQTPGYAPSYMPQPYPPAPQSQSPNSAGTITEEHIRASLLSAVNDKLRVSVAERLNQYKAEIDTLDRTQQELTYGKNKLDRIIEKMEKEQAELEKNVIILQDKETELEKSISRLSEQQPIDVDEAVTTTAPLYKQLLNAFAEEAATEDAIYYMGEALRRGVIDLDVFLKQVRALSRKQFVLRALMHKCRQRAGLAG